MKHQNQSPPIWSFRQCSAFSLLELLAIIAVLAILIALLFPVMEKAASKATSAQCLGKLRQLSVAAHSYIGDNFGKLPCRPQDDPPSPNWMVNLAPYLGVDEKSKDGIKPGSSIYLCPGDPSRNPRQTRTYRYSQTFPSPGNPGFRGNYTPSRYLEIVKPSAHAMFLCVAYTGALKFKLWTFENAAWSEKADNTNLPETTSEWPRPHYRGTAINVLFSDGHAAAVPYPLPPNIWHFDGQ